MKWVFPITALTVFLLLSYLTYPAKKEGKICSRFQTRFSFYHTLRFQTREFNETKRKETIFFSFFNFFLYMMMMMIEIKAPYSLNRQSNAVILIHPTRHSTEIKRF